jgi:hypothetical protein
MGVEKMSAWTAFIIAGVVIAGFGLWAGLSKKIH